MDKYIFKVEIRLQLKGDNTCSVTRYTGPLPCASQVAGAITNRVFDEFPSLKDFTITDINTQLKIDYIK